MLTTRTPDAKRENIPERHYLKGGKLDTNTCHIRSFEALLAFSSITNLHVVRGRAYVFWLQRRRFEPNHAWWGLVVVTVAECMLD